MSDIPNVYVPNYSSSSELWKEMTNMLPLKFIQDKGMNKMRGQKLQRQTADLTAQGTFKI